MSVIQIEVYRQKTVMITLNRPEKYNALNGELVKSLTEALLDAEKNPEIRIICLTGAGKYFCAGGDLAWMQYISSASMTENIDDAKAISLLMETLYGLSKPTIALINGNAIGGGAGLVACCDIAISVDNAAFCFSEARLGIAPAIISPYIIKAIGERSARYYFLTTQLFDAKEAALLGLVHKITDRENLMAAADNHIDLLEKNGPHAMQAVKKLFSPATAEKIDSNIQCLANLRASPEGQEGLAAFLEKRLPRW